jgi:protein-tyrosine phosphatase
MKVLMVCMGNICRSPIAEGVLKSIAQKQGLDIEVDSAGTVNYHVGEMADRRSIACMHSHGIDISTHRARLFSTLDFDYYDIIFVMDRNNYEDVLELAQFEIQQNKVKLLLSEISENQANEVPDPYYGSQNDFETVYNLCNEAISQFINTHLSSLQN